MMGAAWGALAGNRLERFLAPERSLDLLNREGENQLSITLTDFRIERDPAGRPEQFRSTLNLVEPGGGLDQNRENQCESPAPSWHHDLPS